VQLLVLDQAAGACRRSSDRGCFAGLGFQKSEGPAGITMIIPEIR